MRYRNKHTGDLFEIEWVWVHDLPVAVLHGSDSVMPLTTARCGHGLTEDFEQVPDKEGNSNAH